MFLNANWYSEYLHGADVKMTYASRHSVPFFTAIDVHCAARSQSKTYPCQAVAERNISKSFSVVLQYTLVNHNKHG
jgi:hypothetical protein